MNDKNEILKRYVAGEINLLEAQENFLSIGICKKLSKNILINTKRDNIYSLSKKIINEDSNNIEEEYFFEIEFE